MLNIAAVQTGNFEKRGAEYVAKLFDGIRRHMPDTPYRCICFTDDPTTLPKGVIAKPVREGIAGWWHKMEMFAPDAFEPGERVLSFDLDTIITDSLADIASYAGDLAMLRDPFFPEHMGSACMAWEAGKADHIWTMWDEAGRPSFHPGGDQAWIEAVTPAVDYLQDMYSGQFASFKADCWLQGRIPTGTRVLLFHGHPRPHECRATFVEELWNRSSQKAA